MKKLLILLIVWTCVVKIQAQLKYSYTIRNYCQTTVMNYYNNELHQCEISNYGDLNHVQEQEEFVNHYWFHGQEVDTDLGIYYFKSRLFDKQSKRFLQVDPGNQYFSPYLFVQGDPVNYIDFDGNAGKPLYLYGEFHFAEDDAIAPSTFSMRTAVPNAHYVPMSDFLNGRVGDLPEWNGNVFIEGHMGDVAGKEMIAESTAHPHLLKTQHPSAKMRVERPKGASFDMYHMDMDAREFGRSLRRFADARDVRLKNVVAGGCRGSYAAEKMSEGFGGRRVYGKGEGDVHFSGVNREYRMNYTGRMGSNHLGLEDRYLKHDRTRAAAVHEDIELEDYKPGSKKLQYKNAKGKLKTVDSIEGRELEEFMNGRIPGKLAKNFETFHVVY